MHQYGSPTKFLRFSLSRRHNSCPNKQTMFSFWVSAIFYWVAHCDPFKSCSRTVKGKSAGIWNMQCWPASKLAESLLCVSTSWTWRGASDWISSQLIFCSMDNQKSKWTCSKKQAGLFWKQPTDRLKTDKSAIFWLDFRPSGHVRFKNEVM